jgi:hypothetical protein
MSALAPALAGVPRPIVAPTFQEALRQLASQRRQQILADLSRLAEVVDQMGALDDVGRWWR